LVTAAGHDQHRIEAQTGWVIKKFVRDTRSYRIVKSRPTSKPAPPPTRYPRTSGKALAMTRADVRTNVSQVGEAVACSATGDGASPLLARIAPGDR